MTPRRGANLPTSRGRSRRPLSTPSPGSATPAISPTRGSSIENLNSYLTHPDAVPVGVSRNCRRENQMLSERNLALAQEPEELDSLAKPALHHFRTPYHFTDDRSDLRRPQVESPVEVLDRLENFGMTQMRVAQCRCLRAEIGQKFRAFIDQPAVRERLFVKESTWIGRGERD